MQDVACLDHTSTGAEGNSGDPPVQPPAAAGFLLQVAQESIRVFSDVSREGDSTASDAHKDLQYHGYDYMVRTKTKGMHESSILQASFNALFESGGGDLGYLIPTGARDNFCIQQWSNCKIRMGKVCS